MKGLIRFLVLVTLVLAAGWFFLKNDTGVARRISDWAGNSIMHIEALLEERDTQGSDTSDDSLPYPDDQYSSRLENGADESLAEGDGVSVTSGYSISSELVVSQNGQPAGRRDAFEGEALNGTVSEHMNWVKTVTQKYAPLSWELLMLYDGLPRNMEAETVDGMTMSSHKSMDSFAFMEGNSAVEMLGSMATNVHETAHGYFSDNIFRYAGEKRIQLDWENVNGFLYLSGSENYFISFPKKMLFPSRELVGEIPRELRTFRFETYVAGKTSTQGQGVIGLLDEFHAYYHGARCSFDLFEAYADAEGSEVNGLLEWIRKTQSDMTAYYEFDFFIKEYLLRMQAVHPGEYEALRHCSSFVMAYRSLSTEYSGLVRSYEKRINDEMNELNGSGEFEAEVREGTLWISYASADGMRSRGTSIFHEDKGTLEPVLMSGRYDKIMSDFLWKSKSR